MPENIVLQEFWYEVTLGSMVISYCDYILSDCVST